MWLSGGVRPSLAQGQRRVTVPGSPRRGVPSYTSKATGEEPDGLGVDAAPVRTVGSTRGRETWGLSCTAVLSLVARRTSSTGVIALVVDRFHSGFEARMFIVHAGHHRS